MPHPRERISRFFSRHRFVTIVAAAIAGVVASGPLQAAATRIQHYILGTIDYEDTTSGPIILGEQSGSGIGLEGVTTTDAPAGAIALDGFGTSTTEASVGVNGSVDGPDSTALIGNANDTTGEASIGLEGFSQNGEGVFAEGSDGSPSLRSVDANLFYDVRLSDTLGGNGVTSLLDTTSNGAAVLGVDEANTSGNIGVRGETTNGFAGVEGSALGTGVDDGVLGTAISGVTATEGDSFDGNGVAGGSGDGPGVYGQSSSLYGVDGFSSTGTGTLGVTENPSDTTLSTQAGVEGLDSSSDGGSLNYGVQGVSANGIGVIGTSTNNIGVEGLSSSESGIGVRAESAFIGLTATSTGGIGLEASSANTGAEIYGSYTTGTGVMTIAFDALVPVCGDGDGTGDLIVGENFDEEEVYSVDCSGTVGMVVPTRHHLYANTTTPQATQPVLEDYGEAQLVNGSASVKLDPAFAETISDRSPYLVFLTPDGDSRGLYVTQKTMEGFVVRENGGGTASLTFDYRIVAKPAGATRGRMTLMAAAPRVHSNFVDPPRTLDRIPQSARTIQLARSMSARFAAQAKRHLALAAAAARHLPKRLPLYEPRIGSDGKLLPGAPYSPPSKG